MLSDAELRKIRELAKWIEDERRDSGEWPKFHVIAMQYAEDAPRLLDEIERLRAALQVIADITWAAWPREIAREALGVSSQARPT